MDFDGEDLARDRGPDVGAHDNADGLRQGHEPRVDEADRHDRGGAAALDENGDAAPTSTPMIGVLVSVPISCRNRPRLSAVGPH